MTGLYIFGGLALLVLAIFFCGKALGAGQEREEQLEETCEQSKKQLEIAARGPAPRDDVLSGMFDGEM